MGAVVDRHRFGGRRALGERDHGCNSYRARGRLGTAGKHFQSILRGQILCNTGLSGRMEIREILAANLKRYRQEAGLSQEELAHRAEVDRTYVSALERCIYAASIDVVDRLARELGVEAADLLRRGDRV